MGTQKNRLSETILLSTHNIGFALIMREKWGEKELNTPPYLDLCLQYLVILFELCILVSFDVISLQTSIFNLLFAIFESRLLLTCQILLASVNPLLHMTFQRSSVEQSSDKLFQQSRKLKKNY